MKESLQNQNLSMVANFWGESFYNTPRSFKKKMKHLLKTTIIICEELFDYFSSETGRSKSRKVLSINDIKEITGFSKSAILKSIDEIESNDIFLVYREGAGKDKTYGFYVKTFKNIELFDKIKNGATLLKLNIKKDFNEINNNITEIIFTNNIEKTVHEKNQVDHKKNQNCYKKNQNDLEKNQVDHKKNQSEALEILENTDIFPIGNTSQESYIKEYLSKETLTLEKNISNDSSLEKKLLESELKVKAFLESEVKEQIHEKDKELKIDSKNDNELDRLKSILISDYQMYEAVAEKTLKQYSTKAINECIDLTIQAEVNETIKSTPRDFLMNKLKYWVEKKESVQEISSPYKKVVVLAPVESDFINIFYTKKLVHISQKTLGNCVQALISSARKDVILEIKEKFSREQIGLFINHFQNTDTFAHKYTNDVARFWQFYNDIQELDKYNQELKKRNEKARLEIMSKFNNSVKKDESTELTKKLDTFNSLSNLVNEEDSEVIPF